MEENAKILDSNVRIKAIHSLLHSNSALFSPATAIASLHLAKFTSGVMAVDHIDTNKAYSFTWKNTPIETLAGQNSQEIFLAELSENRHFLMTGKFRENDALYYQVIQGLGPPFLMQSLILDKAARQILPLNSGATKIQDSRSLSLQIGESTITLDRYWHTFGIVKPLGSCEKVFGN